MKIKIYMYMTVPSTGALKNLYVHKPSVKIRRLMD